MKISLTSLVRCASTRIPSGRSRVARVCGAALLGATLSMSAVASQAASEQGNSDGSTSNASAPADVTMLRLFDGATLWGSIVGHDAQTLHFQRLDNGGRVRLPWSKLDPTLSDQLLETLGYSDRSGDEVIVEVDRLVLNDGSEIIGIIVNRTPTELWVKTAQATRPVPMLRLREALFFIDLASIEIYTREELYQQESVKLDPSSPQAQWDLSVYCERIYDFAHALEHLAAAAKLDPNFKKTEIETALARNQVKLSNQAQLDALREIDSDRVRGYFDRALTKIAAFVAANPKSGFLPEAAKKKLQVEKAREAKLRERAVEYWHSWVARLIETKTRDPQLSLEASIAWVEEGLSKELLEAVVKDVQRSVSAEATPDMVTRYWRERQGGKWRRASYGQGTFLLGEDEARKGLVDEEESSSSKPGSETDEARAKLEERIKRYLQNQEMVRKAKQSGDDEDSLEQFWTEYRSYNKAQWLLAYYVEHSGDFQLGKPLFTNCPDCGGTGKREILNVMARQTQSGGGGRSGGSGAAGGPTTQLVDCPMCHAVGIFRRVMYR